MHTKLNSISHAHLLTPSKAWKLTATAAALGTLLSLVHPDANALALGRITALSSLGEPFVAGIEIPDINAEEMASLKVSLASPEAFRLAGMEYSPSIASTQITLTRRDNGSNYLLLRSDKVVSDPFINLVINANWATGRIVRNYTLLLDPPAAKRSEAAAVTAPMAVLPTPAAVTPSSAVTTARPATSTQPAAAALAASPKIPVAKPTTAVTPKAQVATAGEQIKVNVGDTATRIATNNLPANVSLDQMLAAMLRGNPQAFSGNNINRLKAGAILNLPSEAEAASVSASEARQSLLAQSKDFASFRRKLAENAPTLTSKTTDRAASGKIEAKVEDQKAVVVTPDKLTLSKGGLSAGDKSSGTSKENLEKITKERQAKDDAARSAELAKNIKDLNQIASATPAVTPTATTTTAALSVPVTPVAPVVTAAPKPPVVAKAPAVVAPVAETSALDFLMNDPVVLPAAGGLLAALLAGGLYANSKRKKRKAQEQAEEDALSDEHFEEKSFFSETSNAPITEDDALNPEVTDSLEVQDSTSIASTEVSKTETAAVNAHAVVDPLTEANVYLDYGRDVQAEEILKDGLKTQPENVAIYAKLMGIYGKRRDARNFEQMALKAKMLLTDSDPQWLAMSKEGFELEPSNPLYHAGAPDVNDPFANISGTEFSTRTVAQLDPESAKSPASVDLDLDFNFASAFPDSMPAKKVEPPKSPLVDIPDFSLESSAPVATPVIAPVSAPVVAATAAATHAIAAVSNNMPKPLELDLGHLSLDLNSATAKSNTSAAAPESDNNAPLETKLALAQEFRAIGDTAGAKMLVNEVLALATGSLKTRAETFLSEIG